MNALYFPGLASLTDDNYDIEQSEKYCEFAGIMNISPYLYENLTLEPQGYDLFIGSSFGGFFAYFLGIINNTPNIGINPSLLLDERIKMLKEDHSELDFLPENFLADIKSIAQSCPHHPVSRVFMNRDDEVIDFESIKSFCIENNIDLHSYEKGGHVSLNFKSQMLPDIRRYIGV